MNEEPYAQNPHLEIQAALHEARRQGATEATLTFDNAARQATLEDNRNPGQTHRLTFSTNLHPANGYQWDTEQRLRNHVAPRGLSTTLLTRYDTGNGKPFSMPAIGDQNVLEQSLTPDGRHLVYLMTGRRYTQTILVSPNGTSRGIRYNYDHPSYLETGSRKPGTEVTTVHMTSVAVAQHQDDQHEPGTAELTEIENTALSLAATHITRKAKTSQGHVWPSSSLRRRLSQQQPTSQPLPPEPSTSEYTQTDKTGQRRTSLTLTPDNAIICDYDDVQTDLLIYAVGKHAPRDLTPVRTKDPRVPTIRLIGATVENLDGTTTEYPVHLWDMNRQSGREDGKPTPTGYRLPHSRIGTVRNVHLTMEIRRKEAEQPDIFTFRTDVYADQDRQHHLLLATEDTTVSQEELENIAFLHSPRTDRMPQETRRAADRDMEECYNQYLIDTVHHGPQQATRTALRHIAAAAESLDMANPQTGTQDTVEALSPTGQVKIILNPPYAGQPLHPPVDFVKVETGSLMDAAARIVPTTESPGAIQPGHLLQYSTVDGKLETFQPAGTQWNQRVHPLTVRPAESESLNIIRAAAGTAWAVAALGPSHLVLVNVPAPEEQTTPQAAPNQQKE